MNVLYINFLLDNLLTPSHLTLDLVNRSLPLPFSPSIPFIPHVSQFPISEHHLFFFFLHISHNSLPTLFSLPESPSFLLFASPSLFPVPVPRGLGTGLFRGFSYSGRLLRPFHIIPSY
jgi:hypothetical protein